MAGQQQYNVVTNIVANIQGFTKGIQQVTQQSNNFAKQVSNNNKSVDSGFKKLSKTIAGVAGAYLSFQAITNGVKSLAKAMIGGNADMETYQNTLTTVMGSSEKAVEMLKWAEQFAASTPFEIPDIVEATTRLETYGISAKNTLGAIGDMASITGKPLMQAVEAVADAQTGELERLKEFGITKQMLIDKSAEMGKGEIVNAKGQITDMEGLNAALIALMEERYEGGMETASKSFKGMVSNVQDSVGTITRELGKPIFETFKSGLKAIVPVASAVTSFVKGDMTGGVKTLTDAFGEEKTASIMGFFNKLSTGFQTAKTWVLSFAPTISNLGTVFSNLMPVITSVGSIIAGAFLGIASVLPPIFNYITDIAVKITEWGGFVPILSGIVAGFAAFKVIGTLVNVFNNVKTAITAVRTAMLLFNASLLANPIGIIIALLVGLGTAFVVAYQKSDTFRNIVNGVWEAIKGAWSATVSFFTESIPKWVSNVVGYFQNLKDKAVEKWNSFKDSTVSIFNSVKEFFTNTWNNIKSSVTSVITGFVSTITSRWNSFKSTTLSVFNTIKSTLTTIWNTIKSVVSNVVGGIFSTAKSKFDSLKSTVSSIFNSIKSTATSVWNGVKSAITNPIESAKNTISKIIEKIKGFFSGLKLSFPKISMPKLPHFKLTGSFSLKPPSVPKLSVSWYKTGGIFNQASIIGVGEEPGVSEAVLPLKDSVLGKIGAMIANTMNMDRLLTRIDQLVNLTNPNMLMGAFGGGMSQQFIRNLDLVPSTNNNQEIVLHNTFNFNTTGGISDKDMKKASDYFTNGMINKLKLTGKI